MEAHLTPEERRAAERELLAQEFADELVLDVRRFLFWMKKLDLSTMSDVRCYLAAMHSTTTAKVGKTLDSISDVLQADWERREAAHQITPACQEQTDAVSRAIALMLTWAKPGQRYTVKDLAKAAGTSKASLYRDSRFQAARKATKALGNAPPAGSKDAEGGLDAYAPQDEGDGGR